MAKTPAFLQPRLRLFLSADIVGSTALKQRKGGVLGGGPVEEATRGPAWFSAIQGFYFEATQAFMPVWERAKDQSENAGSLYGDPPRVWKTVGDEVIFVKEIIDHRQIVTTLHVWFQAIRRLKEFLKDEETSLDVKSAVWTAGFPYRNKEVVLDKNPSLTHSVEDYYRESGLLLNKHYGKAKSKPSIIIDYIGPSIDTGFRLGNFATGRKLVASVDVAYFVAMTQFDGEVERVDFYYDGSVSLKGVLGGSNYPIFWIDMSEDNSLARREDKMKTQENVDKEDLREYCEAFYKEHEDFTFRPFVPNDPGGTLSKMPHWYQSYQKALSDSFSRIDDPYDRDDQAAASEGSDADEVSVETLISQMKNTLQEE